MGKIPLELTFRVQTQDIQLHSTGTANKLREIDLVWNLYVEKFLLHTFSFTALMLNNQQL